mgnify:CR=1 FL=1
MPVIGKTSIYGELWEDPESVERFRRRLWGQLLELPAEAVPPAGKGLAVWRAQAEANIERAPQDRDGFILPYRLARVRRRGRPSWFIPDELV